MAQTERGRRLVYVKAADMELWRCRPIGSVDVLDLRDQRVGRFDGLLIDARADQPLFIVIRRNTEPPRWFLVPVGDAWFDQTERAVRIDAKVRGGTSPSFHPDEFDRMTAEEAVDYELRVLGECCPEVGVHHDGMPDYSRLAAFQCPAWLRPSGDRVVTQP